MLSQAERRKRMALVEGLLKRRVANLRECAQMLGSFAELARRTGVSDARIHQLCGPNPVRTISEITARDIEQRLGLPAGWLDLEKGQR
jgi:hypothetical protein